MTRQYTVGNRKGRLSIYHTNQAKFRDDADVTLRKLKIPSINDHQSIHYSRGHPSFTFSASDIVLALLQRKDERTIQIDESTLTQSS